MLEKIPGLLTQWILLFRKSVGAAVIFWAQNISAVVGWNCRRVSVSKP